MDISCYKLHFFFHYSLFVNTWFLGFCEFKKPFLNSKTLMESVNRCKVINDKNHNYYILVVFSIQISFMIFSVPLVGIRAILFNPWQIQGCLQPKWHEPLQLEVDFIKGTPLQDCQICLELISTVEAMVLKAITSAEIEALVSIECRVVGTYEFDFDRFLVVLFGLTWINVW